MNRRVADDETLGRRLHDVNRQRAVDRALERLRYGLRADWQYFTGDDHANLRWLLGELWAVSSRDEWESLYFSKLDFESARRLASIGDRLRRHGTSTMVGVQAAAELVRIATEGTGATGVQGRALAAN